MDIPSSCDSSDSVADIRRENALHRMRIEDLREKACQLRLQIDDEKTKYVEKFAELNQLKEHHAKEEHKRLLTDAIKIISTLKCLSTPFSNVGKFLRELDKSAKELLAEHVPLNTSAGKGRNATVDPNLFTPKKLVVVLHSTIRGIQTWAGSHTPLCSHCDAKFKGGNRSEPSTNVMKKAVGVSSFKDIPGKKAYRVTGRIVQQSSLAEVENSDALFFPLLRWQANLVVLIASSSSEGVPMSRVDWVKKMEKWCNDCLSQSLESSRKALDAVVQAYSSEKASSILSPMELFFHTMTAKAVVTPRVEGHDARQVPNGNALHGNHLPPFPPNAVGVDVCITFSSPVHIAALTCLMDIIHDKPLRMTLLTEIIEPALKHFTKKIVPHNDFSPLISEALRHAAVLWDAMESAASGSSEASRLAFLTTLSRVLRVLEMAKTSIEIEFAFPLCGNGAKVKGQVISLNTHSAAGGVPTVCGKVIADKSFRENFDDPRDLSFQSVMTSGLRSTFQYLRSVLRCFAPPQPSLVFPESIDHVKMELLVTVSNIPSPFIIALVSALRDYWGLFSPWTSLASSLAKYWVPQVNWGNVGLGFISNLTVDVYRPFHPCTGVSVTSKVPTSFNSCTPVCEMSKKVMEANLRVAEASFTLSKVLDNMERKVFVGSERVEKYIQDNKESIERKLDEFHTESEDCKKLREQYSLLSIKSIHWLSCSCDLLLPLHQFEKNAPSNSRSEPLLYASFDVKKES